MTVYDLSKNSQFNVLTMPEPEREINGAYIGDLLSWVMGKAQYDNVWMTIMSNVNIVAVAMLRDVAATIVCEGAEIPEDVAARAEQQGINLLVAEKGIYEVCVEVAKLV